MNEQENLDTDPIYRDFERLKPFALAGMRATFNLLSKSFIDAKKRELPCGSVQYAVDRYWGSTVEDMWHFYLVELWLDWRFDEIDMPSFELSWTIAQKWDIPDISEFEDAALAAHWWGRQVIWDTVHSQNIRNLVSAEMSSYKTPMHKWYIVNVLAHHWYELRFMDFCFDALGERIESDELKKHTLRVLWDNPESNQWLLNFSYQVGRAQNPRNINWQSDSKDAVQEWLTHLLTLPLYERIKKAGATYTAISNKLTDCYRENKNVDYIGSSDDEMMDIANESQERPDDLREAQTAEDEEEKIKELIDKISESLSPRLAAMVQDYHKVREEGGKRPTQAEMGEKYGISSRQVRREINRLGEMKEFRIFFERDLKKFRKK